MRAVFIFLTLAFAATCYATMAEVPDQVTLLQDPDATVPESALEADTNDDHDDIHDDSDTVPSSDVARELAHPSDDTAATSDAIDAKMKEAVAHEAPGSDDNAAEHHDEHSHHHKHPWGYSQEGADWAKTTGNAVCSTGKAQSPININTEDSQTACSLAKAGNKMCGEAIKFNYGPSKIASVKNNGHTVQITFAADSSNSFSACGETFPLKQLHFHAKSENTVDGVNSAMEMHMVHVQSGTSNPYAVIGLFLDTPADEDDAMPTAGIAALFDGAGRDCKDGCTKALEGTMVDPSAFLPADKSYYRFQGSFTTPPCTEGVRWFQMKTKGLVTGKTVAAFKENLEFTMGADSPAQADHDNRAIQKMNGRAICRSN